MMIGKRKLLAVIVLALLVFLLVAGVEPVFASYRDVALMSINSKPNAQPPAEVDVQWTGVTEPDRWNRTYDIWEVTRLNGARVVLWRVVHGPGDPYSYRSDFGTSKPGQAFPIYGVLNQSERFSSDKIITPKHLDPNPPFQFEYPNPYPDGWDAEEREICIEYQNIGERDVWHGPICVSAPTDAIPLTLVDELGNPLANYPGDYPGEQRNLKYRYRCGGSWADWTPFKTGVNGQVFVSIDCSTVGDGTKTWDNKITMVLNQTGLEQDVTVDPVFQAAKVNVNLKTCDPETPLSGGTVEQGGGYWYTHGTTDGSGTLSFYAFPDDTVKVRMNYNYGSSTQDSVPVTFPTNEIDFVTTTVSFFNSGTVQIGVSGWPVITMPIELLPGMYNFRIDGNQINGVVVSGCSLYGGVLTLVDELENPLGNYPGDYPGEQRNLKYKYRCGGSWAPWTSFQTDGSGQVFVSIDCSTVGDGTKTWDNKITMVLNQTSLEQDVTVDPVFQAAKVNVNLKTCDPETPLSGGTVEQGGGYWYTHGTTDGSGTLSFYAFPDDTVKVRMNYNYGSSIQDSVPVTFPTTEIDFVTTTVSFFNSGTVQIGVSGWPVITMPIELLPGTYNFRIDGNQINGVVVSGCGLYGGLLTVVDELGNGVAGVTFQAACGGSWQPESPGQTDANGILFTEIPACMTKIRAKVGNSSQEKTTAELDTSGFTYTTEVLRINLKDHAGNLITDEAGSLEQGGGTWIGLGNFNASGYVDVQTFPVASARYRANYNCRSEIKDGIEVVEGAGIQEVDFQTGQVFGTCITQYQGCGWSTFVDGMELLPGTFDFRYPVQTATVTAGGITNLTCP